MALAVAAATRWRGDVTDPDADGGRDRRGQFSFPHLCATLGPVRRCHSYFGVSGAVPGLLCAPGGALQLAGDDGLGAVLLCRHVWRRHAAGSVAQWFGGVVWIGVAVHWRAGRVSLAHAQDRTDGPAVGHRCIYAVAGAALDGHGGVPEHQHRDAHVLALAEWSGAVFHDAGIHFKCCRRS